jgi:hypothetical protein
MDDFAGTQTPMRRLTEPAEAVAELERAVPGPAALRLAVPADIDWQAAESELGVVLPADFKLLRELYPGFVLGDFLVADPESHRATGDELRSGGLGIFGLMAEAIWRQLPLVVPAYLGRGRLLPGRAPVWRLIGPFVLMPWSPRL